MNYKYYDGSGTSLERAQVRNTTLRKLGLGVSICLMAVSGIPFGSLTARAQISCEIESGIQTCIDTRTRVVTSVTEVGQVQPTVTLAQFKENPGVLFHNSSAFGSNITSLMQQGVSTSELSNFLSGVAVNGSVSPENWATILDNVRSGQVEGLTGSKIINSVFSQQMDPDLGVALSNIPNIGNITDINGVLNVLGNNVLKAALQDMNPLQQSVALDQILQATLGSGFNMQDLQNLAKQENIEAILVAITDLAPNMVALIDNAGLEDLQQILSNVLNQIAGTAIGTAVGGALGDAVGGLFGGFAGSTADITGGGGGGGAIFGGSGGGGIGSGGAGGTCGCSTCAVQIPQHHNRIRNEVTTQFEILRRWMITQYFLEHILPALMLMAEQLTAAGIYQVEIIGAFLDAKHQLETQRLFQQLTAQAHKDYHPSEGMCTFGTTVRSLAMSDRKSDLAQTALASRMMQRQSLNGQGIAWQGTDMDMRSRINTFINTYCDQADNQNGLGSLCQHVVPDPGRRNIDVDYTRNVESRLTLELEFADINGSKATTDITPDEQDVFSLGANLFSHNVVPMIEGEKLGGQIPGSTNYMVRLSAAEKYMDLRSVFAKRSVAQNSFAALVGMRAKGDPESAPYTKAVLRELGVSDAKEIEQLLGTNPSYFAQMEVLTKKLYQNPVFYTELYDKPVNVERKGAALQAIGLMQDRDLFNSLLRSEAVLSVLLEVQLEREQEKVTNQKGRIDAAGGR